MKLLQGLYGYTSRHGHTALVEPSELSPAERVLAERLSDLSGYLPCGMPFPEAGYITCFPCGRYYALARTWLDTSPGYRGGTVLTHALFGRVAEVTVVPDVLSLAEHSKPASADDVESYRSTVEVEPARVPQAPLTNAERAYAAVMALLCTCTGKYGRVPALWGEAGQPVDVLAFSWGLMAPSERAGYAACTLALAPRSVEGRDFDFLGVPPEATGSFLGVGTWWWRGGPVPSNGHNVSPWGRQLAAEGVPALRPVLEWCESRGLPWPGTMESSPVARLMAAWGDLPEGERQRRLGVVFPGFSPRGGMSARR